MGRVQILQTIFDSGVIAVIRGSQPQEILDIATALNRGGVGILEVTVDSPGAIGMIEQVAQRADGSQGVIGAGTVLDPETARAALLAGAQFIFTPTLDVRVIEMANRYDKLVIPGVMTPTEILTAYQAGALAVKVFPAATLGPDFFKQVRGPLPHIPLIPTGGVDEHNVEAFIKAGAAAVGIGGALVNKAAVAAGDYESLTARAQLFVDLVQNARNK
ncbi:MAG: bifunctional 4-hydroxy-2-oxoglutarate aldolase/2-dehydro-3-deoxy-phosphogluconate aldolase [Limnochordia bacterium]|jgi:2-dehydro-3-deoxyphosphogluconate aldolase/(4S)-4-hydroxy-2-oxoglutarate aldolase